ncbi:sulfatase-like hydrolase/transferase [Haloferula sp.]|uniref:sulfatase-like hydrolase/transferase n=1 Tax=Haloferula sp. TaxID=2497595 RepID=UPI003C73883F
MSLFLLGLTIAGASPVLNFGQNQQGATSWISSEPGSDLGSAWTFSGAFDQTTPTSGFLGIENAYELTGGGASSSGTTYNSLLGDITLEAWIKPANLTGGKQVIFSSGAAFRGFSLTLWDNTIHFAAKGGENNMTNPTGDLSHTLQVSDVSDFIQVVATLNASGSMSLYVNSLGEGNPGIARGTTSAVTTGSFAGNATAGLGQKISTLGGSSVDANDTWFSGSFGNFRGEMAIFRGYGTVLSGTEIAATYQSVLTEEVVPPVETPVPPNIFMIVADDMDWRDCSPYYDQPGGHVSGTMPGNLTPNMETLASQGMRLDRFQNATAMCAPFRQQLLTGIFPVRNGAIPNHGKVKNGTKSIVHHLSALGYRVGIMGKLHFGPSSSFPFEYLGSTSNTEASDNISEAEEFINRNANQPYCLIVTSNNPHGPWDHGNYVADANSLPILGDAFDTPDYRNTYNSYLGEVSAFDTEVGHWMSQVDAGPNPDNTIFIAMTEQGSSVPSGKWTLYEKGLRTGCLIRWPDQIQAESSTDALIEVVDILPTLLNAVGGDQPSGLERLDGLSFLPVLLGQRDRHKTYAYGIHTAREVQYQPDVGYAIRSVRDNRYKLIWNLQPDEQWIQGSLTSPFPNWVKVANGTTPASPSDRAKAQLLVDRFINRPEYQFYDLEADPFELNNLYDEAEHAERISHLKSKLNSWMISQGDRGVLTEQSVDRSVPLSDTVSPYDAWANTIPFIWYADRLPIANPDGDEDNNFSEWIKSSDPLKMENSGRSGLKILEVLEEGQAATARLSYSRPRNFQGSGISHTLQISDDLQWADAQTIDASATELNLHEDGEFEDAIIEVEHSGAPERMFYRLSVAQPTDTSEVELLYSGEASAANLGNLQTTLNAQSITVTTSATLPSEPVNDGAGSSKAEVLWKMGEDTGMSLVLLEDQIIFSGSSNAEGTLNLWGQLDPTDFGKQMTARLSVEHKATGTIFELSVVVENGSHFSTAALRSSMGYVGTEAATIGHLGNGKLTGLSGTPFGLLQTNLSGVGDALPWSTGNIRYEMIEGRLAPLR